MDIAARLGSCAVLHNSAILKTCLGASDNALTDNVGCWIQDYVPDVRQCVWTRHPGFGLALNLCSALPGSQWATTVRHQLMPQQPLRQYNGLCLVVKRQNVKGFALPCFNRLYGMTVVTVSALMSAGPGNAYADLLITDVVPAEKHPLHNSSIHMQLSAIAAYDPAA